MDNLSYEFGPFLLEPHARRLSRNGDSLPLAAPEFELLLLLVRNHGRVVEKKEIMAAVWPDVDVEENNLTVRMSSLRRALGETKGHHPYIQTVTGRGYCMIVPVKELSGAPAAVVKAEAKKTSPGSAAAHLANGPIPLVATRRTWSGKGFTLYALLLVGLLVIASLVYGVVRWQRQGESQAAVQSMKMSRATHTGRVVSAAVSPDGQTMAYVERDGELHSLWLQRAGTNHPLQLLPAAKVIYKHPVFTHDGNTLYYSKCQPGCKLHRMPVLGGVETALPMRADSPVTFSPDGSRMAYMRVAVVETKTETSLLVANADGTGEEVLNSRSDGMAYQYGAPAWSPDGKIIAFAIFVNEGERPHMKIAGVRVADRTESTLTSQRWRFIKDVAWLPDGDGFIINARDVASAPEIALQIWRISYPGGEARRITNDLNNYMSLGASRDGSTLVTIEMHWTYGVWVAPTDKPSATKQVTRGAVDRRDGYLGLSMTPDGRIVYVSDLAGKRDLWAVNADGTGQVQLTDGPHKDFYPTVTPDGRYIVFESEREGTHSIWRIDADGRNPRRLTRGNYDGEPVCSPDGKSIVYVNYDDGGVPKLRKVSIDGGDSVPLTEEYAMHPVFSPDGKLIAYYRMDLAQRERRDLVFIRADGGAPVKTLPAPKNFGSVMRWNPGGDVLTYRDNTLTSLWRLPLDGSEPSQVMAVSGEHLMMFCYSHDGRRLAYASGPNVSDAVLITGFK